MSTQEIRRNRDGSLDEIVVSECFFHLEQMGKRDWWLGITRGTGPDAKSLDINIHASHKGKLTITVEDEGLGCTEVVR